MGEKPKVGINDDWSGYVIVVWQLLGRHSQHWGLAGIVFGTSVHQHSIGCAHHGHFTADLLRARLLLQWFWTNMTTTKLVQLPVGRALTTVHGMEMAEFTSADIHLLIQAAWKSSKIKTLQIAISIADRIDIRITILFETRKTVGKQHSLLFIDVKQTGLPFYSGKPKFVYKFYNFGCISTSQSSRK